METPGFLRLSECPTSGTRFEVRKPNPQRPRGKGGPQTTPCILAHSYADMDALIFPRIRVSSSDPSCGELGLPFAQHREGPHFSWLTLDGEQQFKFWQLRYPTKPQ